MHLRYWLAAQVWDWETDFRCQFRHILSRACKLGAISNQPGPGGGIAAEQILNHQGRETMALGSWRCSFNTFAVLSSFSQRHACRQANESQPEAPQQEALQISVISDISCRIWNRCNPPLAPG